MCSMLSMSCDTDFQMLSLLQGMLKANTFTAQNAKHTLCSAQCTCGRLKSCNVIKTTKLGELVERKEKKER